MVGARTASILASLARGGPAHCWPEQLVRDCRAATDVSGVGLALMSADGAGGVLATTGGHAQRLEDLQFVLGEGPCRDAARSGRPVLVADLARDAGTRWPAFTRGATEAGVQAAFTFPLQVGAISIGVLDLYRTRRGSLDGPQLSDALAFADAAVAVVLHLQDRVGTATTGATGDVDHPGGGPAAVVERRAVVHQAAGMISVQLDVSLSVALARLRAHAYSTGRPVIEVATDVVDRLVTFNDSDHGVALMPPPQGPTCTGDEEST